KKKGVFLYFYTRELVEQDAFRGWRWSLHLLPFLLLTGLMIPFFLEPVGEKIRVFQSGGIGYEWYSRLQLIIFVLTGAGYSIAAFRIVRKYKRAVLQFISNTDRQMLTWLEYLILGLTLIWGVMIVPGQDDLIFIAVSLFVAFIGVYGFNQVPVYFIQPKFQVIGEVPISPADKYRKSGLTVQQEQALFAALERLMQQACLYEKSDLTLVEVAETLGESPNYLSQAINSQTGGTFYNYVNAFRVKAFIEKLNTSTYQQYTLLALALECGFHSKSTFNKYFKLHTGQTPSAYLKQMAEKQVDQ
ncbi:MAG: AraC family transcriptional regulator, partial [Phaeodactylibacter sp.]|nr:AraC family transcriptional regulator [Phaeodactylibacter sp.]